ncbi:hypothetical protein ACU3L3_07375 [Priestia endophytica]
MEIQGLRFTKDVKYKNVHYNVDVEESWDTKELDTKFVSHIQEYNEHEHTYRNPQKVTLYGEQLEEVSLLEAVKESVKLLHEAKYENDDVAELEEWDGIITSPTEKVKVKDGNVTGVMKVEDAKGRSILNFYETGGIDILTVDDIAPAKQTVKISNHGRVGNPILIKMTKEQLKEWAGGKSVDVKHGDVLDTCTLEELLKCSSSVPILIDENTQGNYEVVCEYGTEVH